MATAAFKLLAALGHLGDPPTHPATAGHAPYVSRGGRWDAQGICAVWVELGLTPRERSEVSVTNARSCPPVTALVISLPADCVAGHEHLLALLQAGEFPLLSTIILVARAAPLAQRVEDESSLAARYQALAAARGLALRVCGQAAEHYGLRDPAARGYGVELTGFMELAALLERAAVRAGQERVLTW